MPKPCSRRREEADFLVKSRGFPPPHVGGYDFSDTLLSGPLKAASEAESQRDSDSKPRVARNELPWVCHRRTVSTLKGLWPQAFPARIGWGAATTLSGLVVR